MDRLALVVSYGGATVRTFLLGRRLCWLEGEVNAAFGQCRAIVDDPRAIRTVDYEVLFPREAAELGCGVGAVVLYESGLALAAADREARAKHLRALLIAAAECRVLTEKIVVHEHDKHEHDKHEHDKHDKHD